MSYRRLSILATFRGMSAPPKARVIGHHNKDKDVNISAPLHATASVVRRSVLSLALLGVMLGGFAGPVPAETVVVVGTDGAQGAFGNPSGNGGTGVTGQIAVAGAGTLNSNGDALNQATAQGGLGGLGGTGGNGFPIGVKGGNGGTGGTGGNAVADAVTSINSAASVATAIAIATGGRYGGGGHYGSAIFPASIGANGLPGVGGNANAHATATNLGGDASATSEARGGGGFSSFNNNGGGGNAVAGATATASGAVKVRATAISGQQAGGIGGLANLNAVFGRSTGEIGRAHV